jgi:hypothetical protein
MWSLLVVVLLTMRAELVPDLTIAAVAQAHPQLTATCNSQILQMQLQGCRA